MPRSGSFWQGRSCNMQEVDAEGLHLPVPFATLCTCGEIQTSKVVRESAWMADQDDPLALRASREPALPSNAAVLVG